MGDTINDRINKKWRLLLWRVFFIVAIVFVAVEVVIFILTLAGDHKNVSVGAELVCHILLPTGIYAASLGIPYYYMKKKELSENGYDWLIALMMYVVLVVPSFEYYKVMLLILLPVIAILLTAVFANSNITLTIGLLSFVSVTIEDILLYRRFEWKQLEEFRFSGYVVVSLGFVIVVIVMSILLNVHTQELMESIDDSAVKQSHLMKELKKDPLTGLYNRRSFEESLEKAIVRAEETGENGYIAIFDIDHFKNVNDTYGHSNGDVVIKALCKMLKEKSEKYGLSFRYGGEEFVILFHSIEKSKVINVVEDVRTEFRCYYFQFMNNSGITCSCGIAEYAKGESAKAWFNRADSALYQAKEAGRNRTVVSE